MSEIGRISVTQLNEYIKFKIDGDIVLKGLCVTGEISNLKTYSSGHMYFTLKDSASSLRCVMFKGYRMSLAFEPQNGDAVSVKGDISVFQRDGVYQLYAVGIEKSGAGELYEKFLALKDKLLKEGLFSEEHKKPIPKIPMKIGVVTSQSGAVFHDITNVAKRRFPLAQITLFPARVQGEGAAKEMSLALEALDKCGLDVAILARGGGSAEDLWQFNDEALARTIYNMNTPVISAVGHETDFTLADFVSDLRAPTPSAAAELAVPDEYELRAQLNALKRDMSKALMGKIDELRMRTDMLLNEMRRKMLLVIPKKRQQTDALKLRLVSAQKNVLNDAKTRLLVNAGRLSGANPAELLKRGYLIALQENRKISSVRELDLSKNLQIRFYDGTAEAKVLEIKEDE